MRSVELGQGRVALIDDADYELLAQWTWGFNNGYAARCTWDRKRKRTGPRVYMHRFLCFGAEVDHIDGNKLNNQRANLRCVTSGENKQNNPARNRFKLKGVQANRSRYQAVIWHQGIRLCLGTFDDSIDAARAYDVAALNLYGPQAYINGV